MYKVGDRVRVIEASHDDVGHGVIEGGVYEVTNSYSNGAVTINAPSDGYFYMTSHQIEKVEESKEMTFPEMVQKLIDGEFEVGTELLSKDNIKNVEQSLYVGKNQYGYGLTTEPGGFFTTSGAFLPSGLNGTWTVQQVKEMSIEELQKELGYKIKIVE